MEILVEAFYGDHAVAIARQVRLQCEGYNAFTLASLQVQSLDDIKLHPFKFQLVRRSG